MSRSEEISNLSNKVNQLCLPSSRGIVLKFFFEISHYLTVPSSKCKNGGCINFFKCHIFKLQAKSHFHFAWPLCCNRLTDRQTGITSDVQLGKPTFHCSKYVHLPLSLINQLHSFKV